MSSNTTNKKTLKNKIKLLRNKIKKKREGTGNLFTWKPKQDALNRLIKKVNENNYKFNQKDVDKLDNILGAIKKILSRNKYKNTKYSQNKKKKINEINNQVKKINRNLALLNTYENKNKSFNKNFYEIKNIKKNVAYYASKNMYINNLSEPFNTPIITWLKETKNKRIDILVYTQNQIEKVRFHLKNRIPIYLSGLARPVNIDEQKFKQLTNYDKTIKEKNEILNNIYTEYFNYVVIGNMHICNRDGSDHVTKTNYHAIHAFAPVFDNVISKDYEYFINNNNNINEKKLTKKINILFTNIFDGLLSYHKIKNLNNKKKNNNGTNNNPAIVISAIGTGAFLGAFHSDQEKTKQIKNIYIKVLIEMIKKYHNKIKIYVAYRDENHLKEEQNMRKIFENAIKHETNLQHTLIGDLFSRQPETDGYKEVYYVNNWDDKSFIGNGLKHDASVDGFFVANAFINNKQVNEDLLNNSYFHNNAIFNANFVPIVVPTNKSLYL